MKRTPLTARAARWSASHPGKALGLWLLFVASAVLLSSVVTTQEASSREAGSGPSRRADEMPHEAGMTPAASEQVLVTAPAGDPDQELDRTQVDGALAELARRMEALPEVDSVGGVTWSDSGDAAMLPIAVRGDPDDAGDHDAPLLAVTDRTCPRFRPFMGENGGRFGRCGR